MTLRTARGGIAKGPFSGNRGFVLVIVLWVLSLLALLAASYGRTSHGDAVRTIQLSDRVKARSLAQAAIERGIFELVRQPLERAWKTDGTTYGFRLDGADLTVALWSERGKLDLNSGSAELLRALLGQAGAGGPEADGLVDAIEDWKDADDLKRLNGAEIDDYRAGGRPAGPANRAFESIERLQQVLGISPEIYRQLIPWITVHSFSPAIDPRSAPAGLLRAVPEIDSALLDEFLASREELEYYEPGSPLPALVAPGGVLGGDAGQVFTVRGMAALPSGVAVTRDVVVWIEDRIEAKFWILDVRSGTP